MKRRQFELAERERLYLQMWRDNGEKVYSEDDIPAWVVEKLGSNSQYPPKDRIKDIIRHVRKYYSSGAKRFCTINGDNFFLEHGYKKIIDYVRNREMMREDEIQRWEEEVFGAGD